MDARNRLEIKGIRRGFVKIVSRFRTLAKVDCLKKFLGKMVHLIIEKDER